MQRFNCERLRDERHKLKESQEETAAKLRISEGTYRKYETGRVNHFPKGFQIVKAATRQIVESMKTYFGLAETDLILEVPVIARLEPNTLPPPPVGEDREERLRLPRTQTIETVCQALANGARYVNLHGVIESRPNDVLYDLRMRMRNEIPRRYVDCLISECADVLRAQTHADLFEVILMRLRKGLSGAIPDLEAHITEIFAATPTGGTPSLGTVSEVVDRCHGKGLQIVFLLGDVDQVERAILDAKLALFHQLGSQVAFVVTSRQAMKPLGERTVHIRVGAFSVEEIEAFLSCELESLTEADRGRVRNHLTHGGEFNRLAVAVDSLRHQLCEGSGTIDAVLARTRKEMSDRIEAEIADLFLKDIGCPELRFETSAFRRLTARSLVDVFRRQLSGPSAIGRSERLLDDLYARGFLKRQRIHEVEYWWEEYFVEVLRERSLPSIPTWAKLFQLAERQLMGMTRRLEQGSSGGALRCAVDALVYLDESQPTPARYHAAAEHIVSLVSTLLPPDVTIPADRALRGHLERLFRQHASPTRRKRTCALFARYLEGCGEWNYALQVLDEVLPRKERGEEHALRLRLLDKLGRFREVLAIVERSVLSGHLSRRPNTSWPSPYLYYAARVEQTRGSLAKALEIYDLLEQQAEPAPVYRIHALIERGTIFIFAEEPDEARRCIETALVLIGLRDPDETLLGRQLADAYRCCARVEKLAGDYVRAREYADRAEGAARTIGYGEGLLWAESLYARLAYFDRKLADAAKRLRAAIQIAVSDGYLGAVPHLLRHLVLVHAASGDSPATDAAYRQALELAKGSGRRYVRGLLHYTMATALMLLGGGSRRKTEVRGLIGDAQKEFRSAGLLDPPFHAMGVRLERALEDPQVLLPDGRLPW